MSASSRSIATVKDAVVRLGGARILERIIGGHVKNTMTAPIELYGYQENDLWRHSVAAAVAAEQLASITKSKFGGLSFTAALLHDIGKLILGRSAPQEDMEQIAKLIYDKEVLVTCEQAEKKVFGFSHADIGAEIAISWQLPHLISNAIRHHHSLGITDENVDERIITDSVKVANIVARAMGEGIGNEGMSLSVDNDISNRLSLSRDQFETICALSAQKLAAVLAMFEK
jgi:putative nucleotidyltransferase with HDIG domain